MRGLPKIPRNSSPKWASAPVFKRLWDEGEGLALNGFPPDSLWTRDRFEQAIKNLPPKVQNGPPWPVPTDSSFVARWMGDNRVRKGFRDTVTMVFFRLHSGDKQIPRKMLELRNSWLRDDELVKQGILRDGEVAVDTADVPPLGPWDAVPGGEMQIKGLASAALEPPAPHNETGGYKIDATLKLGIAQKRQEEKGRTVCFGVTKVLIAVEADKFHPVKGTMFGERKPIPKGVTATGPDGVEISGRPENWDCVVGDLLGDEYLLILRPKGEEIGPISVAVAAERYHFKVGEIDSNGNRRTLPEEDNRERDAVLAMIILAGAKEDESGRVIVARSSCKRRERQG